MELNNYTVLYKAKEGVNPKEIRFNIKAKDKIEAKFKANKESRLNYMYDASNVIKIK